MGQKLEGDELELYRRVDEVLHYSGIHRRRRHSIGERRDNYVPGLRASRHRGRGRGSRDYLIDVQEHQMELPLNEITAQRLEDAVQILFRWKEVIAERRNT